MVEQLAHGSDFLSEQEQVAFSGPDFAFILKPFTDGWNLAIFGAVLAFIAALVFAGHKLPFIKERVRYFRGRARTYQEFIPWILRFSVGMTLIGAGSQAVLISPVAPHQPMFATLQTVLGFLFIAGLALTPTTLCALALAIGALILHPALLENFEIITALIAFLLLGQAKPGVDDLLGLAMHDFGEIVRRFIPLLLRLGLGVSLIYVAIVEKIINPHIFGAIVEHFNITSYIPLSTEMWVVSIALTEILLGLTLLAGLHTRIISVVTFICLSWSFFIFGDEVYAHVTVFGTLFVLMITGGGILSLDNHYAKLRQRHSA